MCKDKLWTKPQATPLQHWGQNAEVKCPAIDLSSCLPACCPSAKHTTPRCCLPPGSSHSPPPLNGPATRESSMKHKQEDRLWSLLDFYFFFFFFHLPSILVFKCQQSGHRNMKDTTHAVPDTSMPCSSCIHRAEKWKILPHSL